MNIQTSPPGRPKAVFGAIVLPLRKELMAFMTNDPDAGRNDERNDAQGRHWNGLQEDFGLFIMMRCCTM